MPFIEEEVKEAWEERAASVEWFNPIQLWRTAKKVKNSSTIASHADHREVQAGFAQIYQPPNRPSFHDFSGHKEFSFDFAADTGDGWRATRAVADLMLRDELKLPSGTSLRRPNVAIFGGDLVYPTASRDEYRRRFIAPFTHAAVQYKVPFGHVEAPVDENSPRIFAVPGNHDWYDGLTAFWSLFCRSRLRGTRRDRARWVGPWAAEQQRSYFALKLPHDWWIWGIDVQLSGWVDTAQRHYFEDLARGPMKTRERPKLIIVVAEPGWVLAHTPDEDDKTRYLAYFRPLSYMANRALLNGIEVRAVLSGDLHHYSRYYGTLHSGPDPDSKRSPFESQCHFVTAGGGGAFSHPTHQLPDSIHLSFKEPWYADLVAKMHPHRYPEKEDSEEAAKSILRKFPGQNPWFMATMAMVWVLTGLTIESAFRHGFRDWFLISLVSVPWFGMVMFARLGKQRFLMEEPTFVRAASLASRWIPWGVGLAALQLAAGGVFGYTLIGCLERYTALGTCLKALLYGLIGSLATWLVLALYLMTCTLKHGRHHNEAFSALRSEQWKNFLRLTLDSNGKMTVYAVGIDSPHDVPCALEPRHIDDFPI